jgi:8-amino-7-oxononanoate synthase
MPVLDDDLQQKIAVLAAKKQQRMLVPSTRAADNAITRSGSELLSFSCNDYFGLSQHPKVIEAAIAATQQYGVGAGASRLVSGNHPCYAELEGELARAKGCEAGLVFGSGYLANMGVIPALMGKNDLILADKFSHACMLDAAKLSGATVLRFAHNNVEHCKMLLEAHRAEHHNCLILTETVFSMDGDRGKVAALKELAEAHDAWLMSDDAHGFGVIEQPVRADIQMGTLSKSLGAYGGYVCGGKTLIEYLQTAARSLVFSTALPPATVAAAKAALDILQDDENLRAAPLKNALYFTQLLGIMWQRFARPPCLKIRRDCVLLFPRSIRKNK